METQENKNTPSNNNDDFYLDKVWESIQTADGQSANSIDKKIYTISSTGIGLAITLIGINALDGNKGIGFDITAASCFWLAIVLNLLSHVLDRYYQTQQMEKVEPLMANKSSKANIITYELIKQHRRNNWWIQVAPALLTVFGAAFLFQ